MSCGTGCGGTPSGCGGNPIARDATAQSQAHGESPLGLGTCMKTGLKIWVPEYETKQSKSKLILRFYISISSESGRGVLI